jgi:hypothetical protein
MIKIYEDSNESTTSTPDNTKTTIEIKLDELRDWCKMSNNREMLDTLSFSHDMSFYVKLSKTILNEKECPKHKDSQLYKALNE